MKGSKVIWGIVDIAWLGLISLDDGGKSSSSNDDDMFEHVNVMNKHLTPRLII